jgi:citrate lyase synthetase
LEALFDAIEERVLNFPQTSQVRDVTTAFDAKVFVSLCKALGILCRYVSILDPVSKKAKLKNDKNEDGESPTKKVKTEVKEEKPHIKRKK